MNTWIEIEAGAKGQMVTAGGGYCDFEWGDDVLLKATRIEDGYVYLLSDSVRFRTDRVTVKA
jgi:hypothetical protein